jgi:hypothetical protein
MIQRQKIFNVYIKPEDTHWEEVEFVAEGFSLGTFIANIVWLIINRLWFLAAIVFCSIYSLAIALEHHFISDLTFSISTKGVVVWAALDFADWRCKKLERQGYVLYDIIVGNSKTEAELRFFDKHLPLRQKKQAPEHTAITNTETPT